MGSDWQPIWKHLSNFNTSSAKDKTSDPWYKTSSNAKLYQFSNQPVKTNRVKGLQKVQEPKSEVFIRWIQLRQPGVHHVEEGKHGGCTCNWLRVNLIPDIISHPRNHQIL